MHLHWCGCSEERKEHSYCHFIQRWQCRFEEILLSLPKWTWSWKTGLDNIVSNCSWYKNSHSISFPQENDKTEVSFICHTGTPHYCLVTRMWPVKAACLKGSLVNCWFIFLCLSFFPLFPHRCTQYLNLSPVLVLWCLFSFIWSLWGPPIGWSLSDLISESGYIR